MKTITQEFKDNIKLLGRELDDVITYEENGVTKTLGSEQLNSVSPHYKSNILKSAMKVLEIDSNIDIPLETIINYQLGVKVRNNEVIDYRDNYDYIDYGNYIVYSSEKKEDTNSYNIICYDKMLYSMINYETPKVSGITITYPITIRNYIDAICSHLGLTFANINDTFPNYDKQISSELYLDSNNNTLGYTFRDVLDELAEVTASVICINENDELELRYRLKDSTTYNTNILTNETITKNGMTIQITGNHNITLTGRCTEEFSQIIKSELILDKGYYYKFTFTGSGTYYPSTTSHQAYVEVKYGDNIEKIYMKSGGGNTQKIFAYEDIKCSLTLVVPESGNQYYNTFVSQVSINKIATGVDYVDEEYIKDVNVNFGEQFGPINTLILSRTNETDEISLSKPTTLSDNDKFAIKIIDNQILNGNDRADYMSDILNELYNLSYIINDYSSTGICYLDLLDRYNVIIDDNVYNCLMLNDDVQRTTGLKEDIYADKPDNKTTSEYITTSKNDREDTRANIIVDKALGSISLEVAQKLDSGDFTKAEIVAKINDNTSQVQIDADNIDLTGKQINLTSDSMSITSTNFSVDTAGNMTCNNATITGGEIQLTSAENTPKIILTNPNNQNVKFQVSSVFLNGYDASGNARFIASTNIGIIKLIDPSYASVTLGPYQLAIKDTNDNLLVGINTNGYGEITCKNIETGNIDCGNCTLNSSTLQTVYFNKTFVNVPKVVLTAHTSTAGVITGKVRDVTTTYFTAIIGGNVSGNIDFDWIAIL